MGGWMPGATRMPGKNAGYRAGRTAHDTVVCHYTVGRNSAGIGAQGYFQFLVRRNGEIVQFAESDALCWHAGNWNGRGPGIEVEYHEGYDGPHPGNIFTPVQLASCGKVVRWLHESDGYPLDFYDGARKAAHRGFITHRSLIQSGDAHHDYWSVDQWQRMVGPAPVPLPPPRKDQSMAATYFEDQPVLFENTDDQALRHSYIKAGKWVAVNLFDPGFCKPDARPSVAVRPDGGQLTVSVLAASGAHSHIASRNRGGPWVKANDA